MIQGHRILNPEKATEDFAGCSALALMTKAPRAGKVKTRLVPPLTSEEAAQLNRCFLEDTGTAIATCCGDSAGLTSRAIARGVAVYTPVGAELDYADILPADFCLLPQRGEKFGDRLYFAAEDLFRCGFETICLIDSDSPSVRSENFSKAVELLSFPGDQIVLGPCDDGGYYLIGLKRLHREVFEAIDWSTDRVFEQTKQRATQIGVGVQELPRGLDIDNHATLRRLCDELLGEDSPNDVAPRTRQFLLELVRRDGRARIWR